jgi:hypothetical protein
MYYKGFYIRRDFLGLIATSNTSTVIIRSRTMEYMKYEIDKIKK